MDILNTILTCVACSTITNGCIACSDPITCTLCNATLNYMTIPIITINTGTSCDCVNNSYALDTNNNCQLCNSFFPQGLCL